MNCSNCGTPLTDDLKFCPNCGTAVQPEPVQQTYAQPDTTQTDPYASQSYASQQSQSYAGSNPYGNASFAQAYSYSSPKFYDCGIEARDIALAVLLSVVTCGIYNIFWFIKMVEDVRKAANDQTSFTGGVTWLLTIITGGIYGWYWYYQAGKKMKYAKQVRNMPAEDNTEILYLVLSIFGFGIINMCLIQSDLNKMATVRQ
ncbi:MAG: DUF4234 domain-containing protein [Clostridia bacterium]|nr:DUF4234 domain-containing protein [Clostridia bacterium]